MNRSARYAFTNRARLSLCSLVAKLYLTRFSCYACYIADEATASVDRQTEQLLQEALDDNFSDGTILTVAHRLDTVIESDYILVLDKGQVIDFGSPADLVRKKGGAFGSMVMDTGEGMAKSLRQSAFRKERESQLDAMARDQGMLLDESDGRGTIRNSGSQSPQSSRRLHKAYEAQLAELRVLPYLQEGEDDSEQSELLGDQVEAVYRDHNNSASR